GIRDGHVTGVQTCALPILVGSRFWLPSRQEIEIRRTGTWLDYPVRGIIRGRWEIGDYEINKGVPYSMFGSGPEIVQAPQAEQRRSEERRVGKEGKTGRAA